MSALQKLQRAGIQTAHRRRPADSSRAVSNRGAFRVSLHELHATMRLLARPFENIQGDVAWKKSG